MNLTHSFAMAAEEGAKVLENCFRLAPALAIH